MTVNSLPEGQGSISVSGTCVLIRQGGYFQELVWLIQGLPNSTNETFKKKSIDSL